MNDETRTPDPMALEDLSERTTKLDESLEALEIRVDLWRTDEQSHYRQIVDELKKDFAAMVHFLREMEAKAGEEWHHIADATVRSLERLEGRLDTAWSDFEAELADNTDTYRQASSRQLEAWRAHVDRLRVHAKLAEMDARDAVHDLEVAFAAARPEMEQAKTAADEAVQTLKASTREVIAHLRTAAGTVAKDLS
jgi:hypothetical protein